MPRTKRLRPIVTETGRTIGFDCSCGASISYREVTSVELSRTIATNIAKAVRTHQRGCNGAITPFTKGGRS